MCQTPFQAQQDQAQPVLTGYARAKCKTGRLAPACYKASYPQTQWLEQDLERVQEKWEPVFRPEHATKTKTYRNCARFRREIIAVAS